MSETKAVAEVLIVAIRGRRTQDVLTDAMHSKHWPADEPGQGSPPYSVAIVCRDGDNLAELGDVTVAELREMVSRGAQPRKCLLVVNGGTSAQLVPTLMTLAGVFDGFTAVDIQSDGETVLYAQTARLIADTICPSCAARNADGWTHCRVCGGL